MRKGFARITREINMHIPYPLDKGEKQTIEFSAIPDQGQRVNSISLDARSSLGLPVYFYVQEGRAAVKNGKLVFSKIPPRSKFPLKVTVVAWQYGKLNEVQTAQSVKRSFYINQ